MNNRPCIFSKELTAHWRCTKTWIKDGKLDIDYFQSNFGKETAPVMDCNKQYYSSHEKTDMLVSDFIHYWKHRDERLLYLKDWHLQKLDMQPFYQVPSYFRSDWLNEYFDSEGSDDYRFVYVGVKNSWTSFHSDVFQSYSWSANICGLKKWIFLFPGEENKLKDNFGNLPFDITSLLEENKKEVKFFTVYQKTGEVIFVPSGWYHQVFNLEDTVSINHNWINSCSIGYFWKHLTKSLELVKKEINDCFSMDGFQEQCQLILCDLTGINYDGFLKMLCYLTKKRLKIFNNLLQNVATTEELETLFISAQPAITKEIIELDQLDKLEQLNQDLQKLKEMLVNVSQSADFQKIADSQRFHETNILITKLEEIDFSCIFAKLSL